MLGSEMLSVPLLAKRAVVLAEVRSTALAITNSLCVLEEEHEKRKPNEVCPGGGGGAGNESGCTAGEFMKVELALKTRLPFFHRPPPLALRVLPVPRVRPGQVVQSSVRRPLMLVVLVTVS